MVSHDKRTSDALAWSSQAPSHIPHLPPSALASLLASLLPHLSTVQLASLIPDRRRDFLSDLPVEVALLVLSFVDDVRTLARAARVNKAWKSLVDDESVWKVLCKRKGILIREEEQILQLGHESTVMVPLREGSRKRKLAQPTGTHPGALASVINLLSAATRTDILPGKASFLSPPPPPPLPPKPPSPTPSITALPALSPSNPEIRSPFSYRTHFKSAHLTEYNWRHSGRLLRSHRSQDAGCVTSLAMDGEWIVVGLANSRVHVFSANTGILAKTLNGHEAGVWSLWLVSKGGGVGAQAKGKESQTHKARRKEKEREQQQEDNVNADENSWTYMLPNTIRGLGVGGNGTGTISSLSSSSSSQDHPFQSIFDSLNPPPSLPDPNGAPFPCEGDAGADAGEQQQASSSSSGATLDGEAGYDMQSDPCNASRGWGQSNAVVLSASCDKNVRVWDVKTGYCLYTLRGHRSTVRCIKALHGRPIAVSGGRDHTVRVWDIQKGTLLRTLEGHTDAVRCLDVYGNQVVSGSYDCSVRLWDVDTGHCLRVFNGHYHQVYTVAFDGERIASGGLDTTVRIWSASSGACLALLQGHSALVCQLQLSAHNNTVITGSSDGQIIIFQIAPATPSATSTSESAGAASASPAVLFSPSISASDSDSSNNSSFSSSPVATKRSQTSTWLPFVATAAHDHYTSETATPPSSPPLLQAPYLHHSSSSPSSPGRKAFRLGRKGGYDVLTRIQAHTSSIAGLQFDESRGVGGVSRKWILSGGNDGRVLLWEWGRVAASREGHHHHRGGREHDRALDVVEYYDGGEEDEEGQMIQLRMVRDLTEGCESLWKVVFRGDVAVICALRAGRTVLEIWSFKPIEEEL